MPYIYQIKAVLNTFYLYVSRNINSTKIVQILGENTVAPSHIKVMKQVHVCLVLETQSWMQHSRWGSYQGGGAELHPSSCCSHSFGCSLRSGWLSRLQAHSQCFSHQHIQVLSIHSMPSLYPHLRLPQPIHRTQCIDNWHWPYHEVCMCPPLCSVTVPLDGISSLYRALSINCIISLASPANFLKVHSTPPSTSPSKDPK